MKLYEIEEAIEACLNAGADEAVDMETGEILALDALQMEREKKLENVACYVKNLMADAEALKAEKEALAKREQAARKKADSLKAWLTDKLHGEKLTTARAAISFRKSEQVNVISPDIFTVWAAENHNELLTYRNPDINKTAVKAAIKNGMELPGVEIVEKQNIQIK